MGVSAFFVTLLHLTLVLAGKDAESNHSSFPYDVGFDIQTVAEVAEILPSHSWEFGTASQALLELYNPEYSVFGHSPFPVPTLDKKDIRSLTYAASKIVIGTGQNSLANGDGATGDPLSLGVSAYLLGKTNQTYADAAVTALNYIVSGAPRFWNGAISHRADVPELWADFMYMAPPFMAYYAAATNNETLLNEAAQQAALYRQILRANTTASYEGIWHHIIGPQSQDLGLWSTGNAWAAGGMTRVLATVMKAPCASTASWKHSVIGQLTTDIKEIIDGAMGAPPDDGLLRNYLNDTSVEHGYGEVSGTTLLAAVVYRMAVLQPGSFGGRYIQWAEKIRRVMGGNDAQGNPHITADGIATPAVNPLNWSDTTPYTQGSPEGNNFVVLMYAAWRDCIKAGVCHHKDDSSIGARSSQHGTLKKRLHRH